MMYAKRIHPLGLSPDYIKIEDRCSPEPEPTKKLRHNHERKRKLIRMLGKGNSIKGLEEYHKLYDKIMREAMYIFRILKARRLMKSYSEYLGMDASYLSTTNNRTKAKRYDYRTLRSMDRVVKKLDRFLEEIK